MSQLNHLKRRLTINQKAIEEFILNMKYLLDNLSLNRIISIDENTFFIAPKNLKIWQSKDGVKRII